MVLNPTILISAGVVLGVLLIVHGWILWRLLGAVGVVRRMEQKLTHFGDALTLLTETTEGGFRAVALELDRSASRTGGAKKAIARPTSARMTAAAKRGRTVEEIAATEQVSEGEVRLRLHLAKQAAQAKAARTRRDRQESSETQPGEEHQHGAMRA